MNALDTNFKNRAHENSVAFSGGLLSVEKHVDALEIKALKNEWLELEESCPNSVLFQSWHWCNNYLDFAATEEAFLPVVLTVRRFGVLVALLPLCIQRNKGMKILTGLTEPFQQYTDILILDGVNLDEVTSTIVTTLKTLDVDFVHFGQVRIDSTLCKIMGDVAKPIGECDAAPFVELGDWPDFDTYHKSVKQKTRKNMRNSRNRLNRSAALTHASAKSGELLKSVIERTYEGREAWLERLGITSRAFMNTDFRAFLERFKSSEDTGVDVLAMTLSHGDKPMSDQWGFVYRGRYYAFMATWHEGYENASPGKLHLSEVIETCYDEGLSVADFMIPASSYKFTWTDKSVSVCDYVLPFSIKGHVYIRLWLGFLRPLAKKVMQATPNGVRAKVMRMLLKR